MAETQSQTPVKNQSATPTPCWSNIVKSTQSYQEQQNQPRASATKVFVDSCKSTKGIAVAIVDANAIIEGGEKLSRCADRFVSVPEVMAEVRDPMSRHRLAVMSFSIGTMEPSPESLRKVINFARATGDLQTLSDVDLKLIALTYTLEAQIHGTKHLRDCPPPVQLVNVKRLPEKDLPGWGNNVPNLEEWEALEDKTTDGSNQNSRILPLKNLNLNVVPQDNHPENGSIDSRSEAYSENPEDTEVGVRNPKRYPPKKTDIKIEGKKMVADGIDASQGEHDDESGDWRPAVSRSTHRRYLRRKARREYYESLSEKDGQQNLEESMEHSAVEAGQYVDQKFNQSSQAHPESGVHQSTETTEDVRADGTLSSILKEMRVEEDSSEAFQEKKMNVCSVENNPEIVDDASDGHPGIAVESNDVDIINEGIDQLDISSETNESIDVSCADDDCSEQSWMLRSLSESSVACITGDFAMQNVLLQMGLRLLAPGGMQIRQLHRWILKCHACSTVTAEIGRIFCPKCGNAGTLRKVAVTVNENGIVLAARRPRITLRGTKFSLPLPQGGRDAITKNLILREDQLPQKLLHPKTKKKANKKEDDFFTSDDIFSNRSDKKSPLRPPIRQALAVFSGKRNPNDNHFSRSKHR